MVISIRAAHFLELSYSAMIQSNRPVMQIFLSQNRTETEIGFGDGKQVERSLMSQME
jgi:hypothetical protein